MNYNPRWPKPSYVPEWWDNINQLLYNYELSHPRDCMIAWYIVCGIGVTLLIGLVCVFAYYQMSHHIHEDSPPVA